MLAGVHEQLLVALSQQPRHGRRLDELGPVADHGEDAHAPSLEAEGPGAGDIRRTSARHGNVAVSPLY